MKLTIFNEETFPRRTGSRSSSASIAFGKSGTVTINQCAAERLGIKAEDGVSFAQDEEDPANWYICKDASGYKARLHSDKKSLVFNHASMCKSIKECLGLDVDSAARFIVTKEPQTVGKVKYWGLIYVNKQ